MFPNRMISYMPVVSKRQVRRNRMIETIVEALLCIVFFSLMAIANGIWWWIFLIITPAYISLTNWGRWKKHWDLLRVGDGKTGQQIYDELPEEDPRS